MFFSNVYLQGRCNQFGGNVLQVRACEKALILFWNPIFLRLIRRGRILCLWLWIIP
jgi:hypothetical protein